MHWSTKNVCSGLICYAKWHVKTKSSCGSLTTREKFKIFCRCDHQRKVQALIKTSERRTRSKAVKSRVRSRNKKKRKPMKAPQSLHPQAIWHTWTWISDVGNSQLCCVDLMSMYDLCSNKHQALYTKPKSVKNFYDFWSSCDTTSLKAIMLWIIRENAYCLLIALGARQTAPRMVKQSTCRTRFAMMWQVYESKIGESWCIMLHMSLHSTTLE